MKNIFKRIYLSVLALTIIVGCNNDDNGDGTIDPIVIDVQDFTLTIDENPSIGETLGSMVASGSENLIFSITEQSPAGALTITEDTGELSVADASLFDYETNPVITATVVVEGATETASITINLNNLDELGIQNLTVEIDENPNNGDFVGIVQVNGNGTSSFSIASQTPAGALNIDQNSGELTVADATLFDFETNPVITATVSVVDAAAPGTVTINLNNIAELTVEDLTTDIDENPTNGDLLGTVQTSGNGTPSFSITDQNPMGAVTIDENTGELTVADASLFDFEVNPVIIATVSVVDGIDVGTVTINLNDVQELTVQNLTVSIDENPTDGQVLGTIQTNSTGTLSFSITSQSQSNALAIAPSTGVLSVTDPNQFDFETNPVITAEISVSDGSETATATATINLNDVDEVSAQNTDLSVDENPTNGDVIGTLQASGSNLSYTITFQNPAGAFTINQSTGELSVADETLFDFEANPNMLATISVSNGIQTVSANAFVTLNDLNEIGEFKYGGIIFWIDPASSNSAGMVISLDYQATGVPWGCSGTTTGANGTAIGAGATNTSTVMASSCAQGSAAEIASNLTLNGYDDWFLPSFDEWDEVYTNITIVGNAITSNGGQTLTNANWSSSEDTSTNALWNNVGSLTSIPKTSTFLNVRAVRAWTDF